jgi:Tfp pilus assembly protein PilW
MTAHRSSGFTLAELLVYIVIAGIVMASSYRLMIMQSRAFSKQREVLDVRDTERSAISALAWDLRHSEMGGGQLAVMNPGSITLRSIQGFGIVCAKHPLLPRVALWKTGGAFAATADDSAMIYSVGRDQWRIVRINQVGTPAAMGVPNCALPGAPVPDVVVQITVLSKLDTSRIIVGAPLRSYRRMEYTEIASTGRWWLGRRIAGATGFEVMTGPLLAPASGGLTFTYYDTLGAVTANSAAVRSVGVTLRAQSFKRSRFFGGTLVFQGDSLTTRIALRR